MQKWKELSAVDKALDRVGVDFTDMVNSTGGFRYVLMVIDHFSQFVNFSPLRVKTSKLVVESFRAYCMDYGSPLEVVADNGIEFCGQEF